MIGMFGQRARIWVTSAGSPSALRSPIDVRGTQSGAEQVFTAEDIERQIAVVPVVPVKKRPD